MKKKESYVFSIFSIFSILSLVSYILFFTSSSFAQSVTARDLTYITEEYKPYNYTENKIIKGFAVDVLKLVWKEMGVKELEINVMPWARGYHSLQNNPKTVLFAAGRSQAREKLFKWVGPITSNSYVLIANKSKKIKINGPKDINKYKVGTIRKDIAEQLLLKMQGIDKNQIKPVVDIEFNIKKLARNRIDLIAYGEKSCNKAIKELSLKDKKINPDDFETVFTIKKTGIYYAFHINTPDELIKQFQDAFDKVSKKKKFNDLYDQYFK